MQFRAPRGYGPYSYGLYSYGLYSYGLSSYDLYSYDLFSDGPYSDGPYSYGLYSYGLYSHGLYSYDLYSYDLYSYGLYSYGTWSTSELSCGPTFLLMFFSFSRARSMLHFMCGGHKKRSASGLQCMVFIMCVTSITWWSFVCMACIDSFVHAHAPCQQVWALRTCLHIFSNAGQHRLSSHMIAHMSLVGTCITVAAAKKSVTANTP